MGNVEGGYNLSRQRPKEYSSDIFSQLGYEDLKKAHTETVIPVTREDVENKKQFASVNQFIQYRDGQVTATFSLQQSSTVSTTITTVLEGNSSKLASTRDEILLHGPHHPALTLITTCLFDIMHVLHSCRFLKLTLFTIYSYVYF